MGAAFGPIMIGPLCDCGVPEDRCPAELLSHWLYWQHVGELDCTGTTLFPITKRDVIAEIERSPPRPLPRTGVGKELGAGGTLLNRGRPANP